MVGGLGVRIQERVKGSKSWGLGQGSRGCRSEVKGLSVVGVRGKGVGSLVVGG